MRIRHAGLFLTVLLGLAVVGCGDDTATGPIEALPRELSLAERDIIAAGNSFGLELFRRTYAAETHDNVFLSPLSASMALGMTMNGAVGETWDGMREGLAFGGLSQDEVNAAYRDLMDLLRGLDPAVEFGIGNSIWIRQGFPVLQSFKDVVARYFDAEARELDFDDPASLDVINGWISDATHGLIEEGIDEISPTDLLFLINAIYFNGRWTEAFDPDDTEPAVFRRDDGSSVVVDMMHRRGAIRQAWSERYVAAELPYGGGAYGMVVVLPHPHVTLDQVVQAMDDAGWRDLTARLDTAVADELVMEMPRFTTRYDTYLNDVLQAMGMDAAFGVDADFRNLTPEGVCIQYVRQKTFVEVDEAGTKAAAVTVVDVGRTSIASMIVDRPFLFAIRERFSGTILFIGTIEDPTLEDAPEVEKPAAGC